MIDYIYDGSFEGLLTCIYHHYYTDKAAGIYTAEDYQPSMLQGYMEITTEADKAEKVYNAIRDKISEFDLRCIYKAYLSSVPNKENILLQYVLLGFRTGRAVSSLHGNTAVNEFQNIVKKISVETERMLQFVRFSVLEGDVLYAEVEPDHDVLELLHTHFCDRFRHDPFIIRDVRRNKAMVAFEGHWYISDFDSKSVPQPSEDEKNYRKLWKTYFDNIAIMERKNPRCQKNHMPERYWKHLTECMTQAD